MDVGEGQRFVAFFDILGFSSWVESDGSAEVFKYVRGFLRLMIDASLPNSKVLPDMEVEVGPSSIGVVNFSDSIIFYSIDDSYDSFKTILNVSGEFANVVICGPSRMIRGGIAHGDFYADSRTGAYVGQALIDAYRLEGKQDWLAVGLHESIEKLPFFKQALIEFDGYIVRSLIPLRKSMIVPYCINWASKKYLSASFSALRSINDCFSKGAKAVRGDQKEYDKLKSKINHTIEFIKHYNQHDD